MTYIIVTFAVEREGDYYVSRCLELGTASFGTNEQEAVDNLADATEAYLDALGELGECHRVLARKGIRIFIDEPGIREMECPTDRDRVIRPAVFPLQTVVA